MSDKPVREFTLVEHMGQKFITKDSSPLEPQESLKVVPKDDHDRIVKELQKLNTAHVNMVNQYADDISDLTAKLKAAEEKAFEFETKYNRIMEINRDYVDKTWRDHSNKQAEKLQRLESVIEEYEMGLEEISKDRSQIQSNSTGVIHDLGPSHLAVTASDSLSRGKELKG